jgi:ATP synthase protein I
MINLLYRGRLAAAFQLLGVGFYIVGSIVAGVLGGRWLDERLGTSPAFTFAGLFLGLLVAGAGVYRMLVPLLRDGDNNDSNSNKEAD